MSATAKRLVKALKPERPLLWATALLGFASILLNVLGPRILGHATDLVFEGSPGHGIDFDAVARTLLLASAVYLVSGLCYIGQVRAATKVVQRTAFRLREDVEGKLARLPVSYFDAQPRGEILSRATNDMDTVVTTLQQSLSPLVNSVLLIVGVLTMMFWISPLVAVIALVVVPASVAVTRTLSRRAQPRFAGQADATGRLNAKLEEMYSAHLLMKAYSQEAASVDAVRELGEEVFRTGFQAQAVSGVIQPAMAFLGNLNYVLVAVVGGLRAVSGTLTVGEVQALIQYSRQLSGPLTQVTNLATMAQAGVASAARVFELLDAPEQSPDSLYRRVSV